MQSSIAGQLSYILSVSLFKLCKDVDLSLVMMFVCTQVPDIVPGWCAGVSILSVLCQDQKTVGSVFATGETRRIEFV